MGRARDENRIGKIRLNTLDLHHLLGMPEGMQIEQIHATSDPAGINILVSGSHLEQQPYDVEAPLLPGWYERRSIRINDRIYQTWEWHPGLVQE